MPEPVYTSEIGGSINDFMNAVRAAFEKQFPPPRDGDRNRTYYWVRDIFEDAVVVNDEAANQLYRVAMTRGSDGITFEPRNKWTKVKLTYATEMVTDDVITEFKNQPPEVPMRDGINLAALTEGDENPFFLTLEISKEGRVSKNGLIHDAELGETLTKQINTRAAEGIMGHIRETDRSTAFPVSDIHWLGAVRQGGSTYAKGYIPKTAVAQREHYRIVRATNGRAATSITGPAVREFVDKKKGTWRAKGFALEQLDLAPHTRAALAPESGFVITREFHNYESEDVQEMTREELIKELQIGDIPASLKEAIVAQHQTAAGEQNRVTELENGVKQRDERIVELEEELETYQLKEFEAAVEATVVEYTNWNVTSDKDKKALAALRKNFQTRLLSELGEERNATRISEIAKLVWADFEDLAETMRDRLAGPGAVVGANPTKSAPSRSNVEAYKESFVSRAKELRAQRGL